MTTRIARGAAVALAALAVGVWGSVPHAATAQTQSLTTSISQDRPLPPARTPQGRQLRIGDRIDGELARGDAVLDAGEYADTYILVGRAGERLRITLRSADIDAWLMASGPGGFSADDDDGGGGTDAALDIELPADGLYRITATSLQGGETGRYSLLVEGAGQTTTSGDGGYDAGSIRVGETRDGRLSDRSARLRSGEYADTWRLDGRRGETLTLDLTSPDFDPYLSITGPRDFSDFNDDADGTDSRLVVTLPADGDYEVMATSYEAGETGRYRLSVQRGGRPGERNPPSGATGGGDRLAIGDRVRGALGGGDDTLDSGEFVDTWTLQGRRGQRVAIDLSSTDFDPYLTLQPPSGEQIDNDDGENGTDSRIDMVLAEDGDYRIGVTSFQPGETGDYALSVTPSMGSPRQASVQGGARVFAVMVGVSDYGGAQNDLPNTDDDARRLAETLDRDGALNPASVVILNAQATRAGVRRAFDQVAAEAGPDDTFLFFFSGHGNQNDTAASALEPDGRSESIVLVDGEISDTEMAQMFGRLRTRLSLLVLDACYSGGFARNVIVRPGTMGMFSSEEDLTSAVADKFEAGGYLSHFLREGLSGAADADGDRLVTAGELTTYLRRQFRDQVDGVEAETQEGQRNYQNLVIDRGGVQVDDVIVRLAAL